MLKIEIYGSSSKGNCYVLDNGVDRIMLDCGIKNLQNKLDLNTISGIILTHLHSDHTKGIKDIKNYYKGKYYANESTLEILPVIKEYKEEIKPGNIFNIGNFDIISFSLVHDVPCIGYLIKDKISNTKTIYATDTGMINFDFVDIDYFLIESNCDEEVLTYEDYKEIRLYDTHLSMQQTLRFLQKNVNANTKIIILCHISSSEENYIKHKEYIQSNLSYTKLKVEALNPKEKETRTIILKKDIEINFD